MIEMIQPMPTPNLPKMNTDFSIDWIVKNDKNAVPVSNGSGRVSSNDKKSATHEPPTVRSHEQSIPKDFDDELSTVLRIQRPPSSRDSDSEDRHRPASSSPITSNMPLYENYGRLIYPESHLIRPMPFLAGTAAGVNPKLHYFDKPPSQPSHHSQNVPLSHPLTPPMDAAAMQQQHILSAQIQAALHYQRHHASGHPQPLNFPQIFSNNFHRTSYQLQPWLINRRYPYGIASGKYIKVRTKAR